MGVICSVVSLVISLMYSHLNLPHRFAGESFRIEWSVVVIFCGQDQTALSCCDDTESNLE